MTDIKGAFSFAFDDDVPEPGAPVIKVIGVGGAGGNAINNMVRNQLSGVSFIAVNTDEQALKKNEAPSTVRIGVESTGGLGAGARPERGFHAAMENRSDIMKHLEGANMVFVTAGLGGGTGTGAAPVIAELARKAGALTVGVVTKPFEFEGKQRNRNAMAGLKALRERVDTLIVIPNEKLLGIATNNLTLMNAFREADSVLLDAVKGISDLMMVPGLVNLDFADVKTIMTEGGMALMGAGIGTGKDRAVSAARQALSSPLLEDTSIDGACRILVNITGGDDLSLMEVKEASQFIVDAAHPEAEVIWGAVIDPEVTDEVRITVVATAFDQLGHTAEVEAHVAEERTVDGPPMPPPIDADYEIEEPAFVSVAPSSTPMAQAASGGSSGGSTRAKPWQVGGLSLNDVLSASDDKESPFAVSEDSEFGPQGYSSDRKR